LKLPIGGSITGIEEGADFAQRDLGKSFNLPLRCLWRLPGGNGLREGASEANAGARRLFFPLIGEGQGLI